MPRSTLLKFAPDGEARVAGVFTTNFDEPEGLWGMIGRRHGIVKDGEPILCVPPGPQKHDSEMARRYVALQNLAAWKPKAKQKVPFFERLVLACTYRRVLVRQEEAAKLAMAFGRFHFYHGAPVLAQMAAHISEMILEDREDFLGLGFAWKEDFLVPDWCRPVWQEDHTGIPRGWNVQTDRKEGDRYFYAFDVLNGTRCKRQCS